MKRALSLIIVFVFQLGCTFTDPEVMELLQALQAQNDKLLEEITSMKGQLSGLDGRYQTILAGLADNKKDLEALKGQVEALKTQIADQLKKIDQINVLLTQQGADVVKLSTELVSVKTSLANLLFKFEEVINNQGASRYPTGSVFGPSGPTIIVDVTNPKTGKTWMDRNLGASRAATSSTDAASYGDLYQWGRGADGHQLRSSTTTTSLSSSNQPGNGNFILAPSGLADWRNPQNDNLWQGVSGVNNPCPIGYRIPTETELDEERGSWVSQNDEGAFSSPLRLPLAGYRDEDDGSIRSVNTMGSYWSSNTKSTTSYTGAIPLIFNCCIAGDGGQNGSSRARGYSVRCIKN